MSEKDWRARIDHIIDCINHIERKTASLTKADFEKDIDCYRIVERNIEIIAEASKRIPADVKGEFPDIPWGNIVGTRNIISHLYDGVDEDVLWEIVRRGIPQLKVAILAMKQRYGEPGT